MPREYPGRLRGGERPPIKQAEQGLGRPLCRGGGVTSGSCRRLRLDLDDFKGVNDSLDHPVGDALLIEVAERPRDCVGDVGLVARLGGDEFAVVVTPATEPKALGYLARLIVEVLSPPYQIKGHNVLIGASVGIAIAPIDAADPDSLLKNADLALYRAKSDGRGAYRFFELSMDVKALGVKIAMDDFGAGYSSLAYLWRFPFDKIKLDRSFVAQMSDNAAITDIVRTITLLGQTLKLQVTAEGVETADQVRMLGEMHCDHSQGFLFGRPMPVGDIPNFLLSDLARRMRRESNEAAEAADAASA